MSYQHNKYSIDTVLSSSCSDLEPLINAVCQLDGGHQQVAEFLKRLIPIYTDMERHMRLAKDSKYVVDVLLEHAVAAILLKDTLKVFPKIIIYIWCQYKMANMKFTLSKVLDRDKTNKINWRIIEIQWVFYVLFAS